MSRHVPDTEGVTPVTALLTAAVLAVPISPPAVTYRPAGCDHIRPPKRASRALTRALKHTHAPDKHKARDAWACVPTRIVAHRLHHRALRLWQWRQKEPQRSWIRYHRMPVEWRVWAERVVQCESGGNPYASNGTHFGRFQWLMSTWAAAGGTGSPVNTSYPQEAMVAISWARRSGTSQWACK